MSLPTHITKCLPKSIDIDRDIDRDKREIREEIKEIKRYSNEDMT